MLKWSDRIDSLIENLRADLPDLQVDIRPQTTEQPVRIIALRRSSEPLEEEGKEVINVAFLRKIPVGLDYGKASKQGVAGRHRGIHFTATSHMAKLPL